MMTTLFAQLRRSGAALAATLLLVSATPFAQAETGGAPALATGSTATGSTKEAGALFATVTIPPGTVLTPGHIQQVAGQRAPGALTQPEEAIGLEAKVAIHRGRPIRAADLGPPTVVQRNAVVSLVFSSGALSIQTEGRAMEPGAVGDRIRVMNLDSKRTIRATVRGVNLAEVN